MINCRRLVNANKMDLFFTVLDTERVLYRCSSLPTSRKASSSLLLIRAPYGRNEAMQLSGLFLWRQKLNFQGLHTEYLRTCWSHLFQMPSHWGQQCSTAWEREGQAFRPGPTWSENKDYLRQIKVGMGDFPEGIPYNKYFKKKKRGKRKPGAWIYAT